MFSLFKNAADVVADTYQELKDAVVDRGEASEDLLNASTPPDRWFTPQKGWSASPAPLSEALAAIGNYKPAPWAPPELLCPKMDDADPGVRDLFHHRESAPCLGELYVEVLEAEGLPNSVLQGGVVDPYAILVFEGGAGRTSQVRNDTTPRWGADAPRAFKFDVRCPYSMLHVALYDDDRTSDDPLGRVVVDIWNLFSHTTYDCWWPLQYGQVQKHVQRRGAVRLRVCVLWQRDRERLLKYANMLAPTFVLPLLSAQAKRGASFAVVGRLKHPGIYRQRVFLVHLKDLRRASRA